jgi:pyruvate/2-oxoglutarate dehydrogenase complex dihydrolipoamide acyltransferase (E2) component
MTRDPIAGLLKAIRISLAMLTAVAGLLAGTLDQSFAATAVTAISQGVVGLTPGGPGVSVTPQGVDGGNRNRVTSQDLGRETDLMMLAPLPLGFTEKSAEPSPWPLLAQQPQATSAACKPGFVWREAGPTDQVCVTAATRAQTAHDNAQAAAHRNPGSDACVPGYVWRDAFPNDRVCVTPSARQQAAEDNRQASSRVGETGPPPSQPIRPVHKPTTPPPPAPAPTGAPPAAPAAASAASPPIVFDGQCHVPQMVDVRSPSTMGITVPMGGGQTCPIKIGDSGRIPVTNLRTTSSPRHGQVSFPYGDTVTYTPQPAYVGYDHFAIAYSTMATTKNIDFTVNVALSVRWLSAPSPAAVSAAAAVGSCLVPDPNRAPPFVRTDLSASAGPRCLMQIGSRGGHVVIVGVSDPSGKLSFVNGNTFVFEPASGRSGFSANFTIAYIVQDEGTRGPGGWENAFQSTVQFILNMVP